MADNDLKVIVKAKMTVNSSPACNALRAEQVTCEINYNEDSHTKAHIFPQYRWRSSFPPV